MKLHTCMISYERPEALKRSLASYLETVSVPFTLVVVDNGSGPKVTEWLRDEFDYGVILLGENRYPGYACNRGWEQAPLDADFLHRADNDFVYRADWCEEVEERFRDERLGQLGLLTERVEGNNETNVGGNCVLRREVWDRGVRWDETPWPLLEPGMSEDTYFSPAVKKKGYTWTRVLRECIDGITTPDPKDEYYVQTYADRDISYVLERIK